jgi:hypothetical protein
VIHEEKEGVVLVGNYLESKPISLASESKEGREKEMMKMPSFNRKDHNFNF